MSDLAIKVEALGKKYLLHHQAAGRRYVALRDVLAEKAQSLFRKGPAGAAASVEEFWALKDVSFEVKRGEVVGIIGRNGAGKSTLLKLLSRITQPTKGRIEIEGRVASLLEVGTGFHPELTGRENVFLNGAILGMGKTEIKRKFDEIVTFAEVEKFLDTPVKRYSSGMYTRLAFAVAAHLEPEILIVDEVLAVGDAEFQKKCLGKMQDVSHGGRTVLFVSHNEDAIRRLCTKAILFEQGRLKFEGGVAKAFGEYRQSRGTSPAGGFSSLKRIHSSKVVAIQDAALELDGFKTDSLLPASRPKLIISIRVFERLTASFEVLLRDVNSNPIMFGPVGLASGFKCDLEPGHHTVTFFLELPVLAQGKYFLDLMVVESGVGFFDYLEEALAFDLLPFNNSNTGWEFRQARAQGSILLGTSCPEIHRNP